MTGLEPVQDVYDNERGDQGGRAESDDELSDEDESDEEEEIAHSMYHSSVSVLLMRKITGIIWKIKANISLFMNKIKQ